MDENERLKLLATMASGPEMLLNVLNGVSEETAARNPAEGRWSILDCVEHLALAENYLLSQILAGQTTDAPPGSSEREARILARGSDRTRTVFAPDVAIPHSKFATIGEALKAFLTVRERTIEFVENCHENLRLKTTTHPIIGPANCYEMLLMISIHPHRHANQIAEIRNILDGNPD